MTDYSIAVLLSAYNGEKYIEKQMESILAQKLDGKLTIIVRNDGSKDSTAEILEKLQHEHECIQVINGENIGLVASFLSLLEYALQAGYDYYSFSDQDDYWLPDKLQAAVSAIADKDSPCMYGACSKLTDGQLNETGSITQTKRREITLYNAAIQNFCPGHNQVLNRKMAELVQSHTKYSPEIYSQDLWITKVAALTGEIVFDSEPRVLYRQHSNNQLSYGKSRISWIKDHLKRLGKSEGRKFTIQLEYFASCYEDYLSDEQKNEIDSFIGCQHSFAKRLGYIFRTRMYRQKPHETLLFKVIYLFGGYNAN